MRVQNFEVCSLRTWAFFIGVEQELEPEHDRVEQGAGIAGRGLEVRRAEREGAGNAEVTHLVKYGA